MDIALPFILLLAFVVGFVEGISKLKHYFIYITLTFETTMQLASLFLESRNLVVFISLQIIFKKCVMNTFGETKVKN